MDFGSRWIFHIKWYCPEWAAVAHGEVNTAIEVTKALGARIDPAITSIDSIRVILQLNRTIDLSIPITIYNPKVPRMVDEETVRMMQQVQRTLGYEFKDTGLLLEAMTHESVKMDESYTRLEFLGDAVLEFSVTEYYYKRFPYVPLEDLRAFKCEVLSNNPLGSLYASLRLEDTIIVGDWYLKSSLRNDAARANQFKPNREVGWYNLNINKILGDAMEALIGAVFVDGGFVLEPVQEILNRTLVPFVERSGLGCPMLSTCSGEMTLPATELKRKNKGSAGICKRARN
ncbi:Dicer-like protein 1 [Entomortierella chlamydospora]|uniref:Dicer-like protein 1 n=1 Tax=Entomortierella chlamydospora TaxID=101097 RepID=A0A9P6T0W6_9FUNG|nr:Dicer-like protein 1 [Entomortierella chlamydospora]KAG0016657.1 Dicer-like protein 1 [Entomortierella chlamydospora]